MGEFPFTSLNVFLPKGDMYSGIAGIANFHVILYSRNGFCVSVNDASGDADI